LRGLSASVIGEDASPEGRHLTLVLAVSGFGVYGLLAAESGTHRMTHIHKASGRESKQTFTANVQVLPELSEDDLPAVPAALKTHVKSINRAGLLISHLHTQATAQAEGQAPLILASNLPAEDVSAEAARLLRIRWHMQATDSSKVEPPSGGIVRSYTLSTKDKGIHDHRTGLRSLKVKQVLEGDVQEFLDAALEQRRQRT
jgi:protein subunit release factor A